eukprot:m.257463 g.257463  ORF g.257463 m.257463 type:complete len:217 (+) comp19635_c0_seq10:623-1273(+)
MLGSCLSLRTSSHVPSLKLLCCAEGVSYPVGENRPTLVHVIATILVEYNVQTVRVPDEVFAEDAEPSVFLQRVAVHARAARATYRAHGLHVPTGFIGLCLMGEQLSVAAIIDGIRQLLEQTRRRTHTTVAAPDTAVVEVMVHPGYAARAGTGAGCSTVAGPDAFACSPAREHELRTLVAHSDSGRCQLQEAVLEQGWGVLRAPSARALASLLLGSV